MTELLDNAERVSTRAYPRPLAPPVGRPTAESPALAWVRLHAASLAIVASLLVLAAVLIGTGSGRFPAFADDEGTYVAEAWAVLAHGSLSHYTYWYDHPPLGWLVLAVLTWVSGPFTPGGAAVPAARALMIVPALLDVALLYLLARRLGVRRAFAALAVVLLVASPLGLASLREVYLDTLALPWLLGAFVLAASPSRRLSAFAGSGVCMAAAVLTKETMLLFLPGLVLLLVPRLDRRTRAFCLTAFIAALALVGLGYPLYAALKGELLPGHGHVSLLQAVEFQLYGRPGTGSVLSAHSAAHGLVNTWLQVDPWLIALGVAALPVGLFSARLRGPALALLLGVLAVFRGGYLPQPFVIGLLPFCALLAAGALDVLWSARLPDWRGIRTGAAATAGLVAVLAAFIVPAWATGDSAAMHTNVTSSTLAAERWIERHVDHRARLLVDDTMYVDLVRSGFAQRFGVVWFYKLDFTTNLDPSIVHHLPKGWREFDYVVSTPVIRSALAQEPRGLQQVRAALAHSQPVATFGAGSLRVQVRRIVGTGTGSGFITAQGTPVHRTGRTHR